MHKGYDPRDYGPVPVWRLVDLKLDIKRLDGEAAANRVGAFAESVSDRIDFAKYHYQEAVRLLGNELEKMSPTDAFVYIFAKDAKAHWVESNARAALTAFFQCLHPIEDHLGHAIYFGLNLDKSAPFKTDRDISLGAVSKKKLSLWPLLKELVDDLESDATLRYVRDLVNHTKHRHIVPIEVSGSDDAAPGLMIGTFTYTDGKGLSTYYAQEWALPKVRDAFYAMQRHVMRIGLQLNWEVAART